MGLSFMNSKCMAAAMVLIFAGCADTPIRTDYAFFSSYGGHALCGVYEEGLFECRSKGGRQGKYINEDWRDHCEGAKSAAAALLDKRGVLDDVEFYCENPLNYDERKQALLEAEATARFAKAWHTEVFNIDRIRVTHHRKKESSCFRGTQHKFILEGAIGADSSVALERLFARNKPCTTSYGLEMFPFEISLQSGGGLLEHGYELGEIIRKYRATTIIEDERLCASSCAVAFLGGVRRVVQPEGQLMFHAPYRITDVQENYWGKDNITIDCRIDSSELAKLRRHYRNMTSSETGEILMDRTMSYCSAEDGWVVTGGAAAELYGIATER
jgi:ATP-dependent protease ClpP protease subunit